MARCFTPAQSEPCALTNKAMIEPYNPYEPNLDRIGDTEQMRREREEQLRIQQERLRQQEKERLRQLEEQQRRNCIRP